VPDQAEPVATSALARQPGYHGRRHEAPQGLGPVAFPKPELDRRYRRGPQTLAVPGKAAIAPALEQPNVGCRREVPARAGAAPGAEPERYSPGQRGDKLPQAVNRLASVAP